MKSVLSRALTKKSSWDDKEELLDIVYWSRQILALALGVVWGSVPLVGIVGIVGYVGVTTLVMNFYVSEYQGQDIENYGGFFELAKEGFMTAFATFLVAWIIVYSSLHGASVI